ncbi:MAG: hypothetical protein Q4Q23_05750 [Methanobacteriaceae archaeon]|nr:hypothetical protein [Methanobacteriaceae archaeon]
MLVIFDEEYIKTLYPEILEHNRYIPRWIFQIIEHYFPDSRKIREEYLADNKSIKQSNEIKMNELTDSITRLDYPDDLNWMCMEVLNFLDTNPMWRNIVKEVKFGEDPLPPECLRK